MFGQHNANDILGLVYICTVKKKKKKTDNLPVI